jgi:hypothetical protein
MNDILELYGKVREGTARASEVYDLYAWIKKTGGKFKQILTLLENKYLQLKAKQLINDVKVDGYYLG